MMPKKHDTISRAKYLQECNSGGHTLTGNYGFIIGLTGHSTGGKSGLILEAWPTI